jgi:hypothetical protein
MTLVVGRVHGGEVSLVADTKITDEIGDESWNRQVYRNACPKIRILRDDLAVGVAGRNPHQVLRRLGDLRARPVDDVLSALATNPYASFVVASLSPSCRLWQVKNCQVEDRTSIGQCRIGDPEGIEIFTQQYHQVESSLPTADTPFLLTASMQWLISFGPVESVGGYLTRLRTTSRGFRFAHDYTDIGPDLVDGVFRRTEEGGALDLRAPADVASRGFEVRLAVGETPTIGALACLIPQARTGWLFCDETPWVARVISTETMTDLVRVAATDYRQKLVGPPS